MGIDGEWERGRVWLKKLRTEERAVTIYRRPNNTSTELVYTGEIVPGWNEDFAALWNEAVDEANLREEEKQAAPRNAYLHLLSWRVAQVLAHNGDSSPFLLTLSGAGPAKMEGGREGWREREGEGGGRGEEEVLGWWEMSGWVNPT